MHTASHACYPQAFHLGNTWLGPPTKLPSQLCSVSCVCVCCCLSSNLLPHVACRFDRQTARPSPAPLSDSPAALGPGAYLGGDNLPASYTGADVKAGHKHAAPHAVDFTRGSARPGSAPPGAMLGRRGSGLNDPDWSNVLDWGTDIRAGCDSWPASPNATSVPRHCQHPMVTHSVQIEEFVPAQLDEGDAEASSSGPAARPDTTSALQYARTRYSTNLTGDAQHVNGAGSAPASPTQSILRISSLHIQSRPSTSQHSSMLQQRVSNASKRPSSAPVTQYAGPQAMIAASRPSRLMSNSLGRHTARSVLSSPVYKTIAHSHNRPMSASAYSDVASPSGGHLSSWGMCQGAVRASGRCNSPSNAAQCTGEGSATVLGLQQLQKYSSAGLASRVKGGKFQMGSRAAAAKCLRAMSVGSIVPPAAVSVRQNETELEYDPVDEVQGHRARSPAWSLPPHRLDLSKKWALLAAQAALI